MYRLIVCNHMEQSEKQLEWMEKSEITVIQQMRSWITLTLQWTVFDMTWHQSSVTIRTKCFIRTFSCDCFFLLSFSASLLFFSSLLSAFLAFFGLSVLLSTPSLSPLSEHETRQTDFRNVSPFSFPRYFLRI